MAPKPAPPADARSTRVADSPMSPARILRKAPPAATPQLETTVQGVENPEAETPAEILALVDGMHLESDAIEPENDNANTVRTEGAEGEEQQNDKLDDYKDPWGRPYIIQRSKLVVPESGDHPHYPQHDKTYRFMRSHSAVDDESISGDQMTIATTASRAQYNNELLMITDRKYEQWSSLWMTEEDDEAVHMLTEVIDIYERFHGVASVQVAEACMRLGDVLCRQSELPKHPTTGEEIADSEAKAFSLEKTVEAKNMYRRSIETYKSSIGDKHASLVDSYIAVGPYPKLTIHNEVSNDHHSASRDRNSRASLPMKEAELIEHLVAHGYDKKFVDETMQYAKDEALRAGGHFDGPDPYENMAPEDMKYDILNWRMCLVDAHMREKEFDKALEVQAEVVANFATHPSLPIALAKLGEIKYNAGDFRGADKDWEDALAVLRQTPEGEMHPAAGRVYGNLGAVALKQERFEEAHSMHSKALKIRKKVLGPFHARVGDSYYNLGNVALAQDFFDQARTFYGKALDIKRGQAQQMEMEMEQTSQDKGAAKLKNMSSSGTNENKGEGAQTPALSYMQKELIERAMSDEMDEASSSDHRSLNPEANGEISEYINNEHIQIAKVYHQLGVVSGARGSFDDALNLFKKALDIHLKELGEMHDDVVLCYTSLGGVHQAQGDYDGAKAHFGKALRIVRSLHGPGTVEFAKSLYNMGGALFMQERKNEAWKTIDECVRLFVKTLGEEHSHTKKARAMLVEIHEGFFGVSRDSTIGGKVGKRGRLSMADPVAEMPRAF